MATVLVLAGAALVIAGLWLSWWSAIAHISLPSAAAQQAGFPIPTSTYPFGDVPGRTVWIGWVAALLALAAFAGLVTASGPASAERRMFMGRAVMIAGLSILVTGAAGMFAGNLFVVGGIEHSLAHLTNGAITTISQFEARVGRGAEISFSTSPGAGILVVMLGGIAIAVGGGLIASTDQQRRPEPRTRG